MQFPDFLCPAAADPPPAQRADVTNDNHAQDRPMDSDEERDYADQGPLTEMDMEEDAKILTLLLKHMQSCIYAADIEQLVLDIPVQPSVVVPVRTVQEAVAAGAADTPQAGREVDCRGAERHPGEQPGSQPRGQRAASDIRLHSVGV